MLAIIQPTGKSCYLYVRLSPKSLCFPYLPEPLHSLPNCCLPSGIPPTCSLCQSSSEEVANVTRSQAEARACWLEFFFTIFRIQTQLFKITAGPCRSGSSCSFRLISHHVFSDSLVQLFPYSVLPGHFCKSLTCAQGALTCPHSWAHSLVPLEVGASSKRKTVLSFF